MTLRRKRGEVLPKDGVIKRDILYRGDPRGRYPKPHLRKKKPKMMNLMKVAIQEELRELGQVKKKKKPKWKILAEDRRKRGFLRKPWTPLQIEIATCLGDPADMRTQTKLAEVFGIASKTITRWKRDPDFIRLINDKLNELMEKDRHRVWKALVKRAVKGSHKNMKLYFQLTGEFVERRKNLDPRDFSSMSRREIEQEIDRLIATTGRKPRRSPEAAD